MESKRKESIRSVQSVMSCEGFFLNRFMHYLIVFFYPTSLLLTTIMKAKLRYMPLRKVSGMIFNLHVSLLGKLAFGLFNTEVNKNVNCV